MTMYTTGLQGYIKFPWLSLSTSSKVCSPWGKKDLTNIYRINEFQNELENQGKVMSDGLAPSASQSIKIQNLYIYSAQCINLHPQEQERELKEMRRW